MKVICKIFGSLSVQFCMLNVFYYYIFLKNIYLFVENPFLMYLKFLFVLFFIYNIYIQWWHAIFCIIACKCYYVSRLSTKSLFNLYMRPNTTQNHTPQLKHGLVFILIQFCSYSLCLVRKAVVSNPVSSVFRLSYLQYCLSPSNLACSRNSSHISCVIPFIQFSVNLPYFNLPYCFHFKS